jgi:rhamnogalacturonan endolyase
VGDWREEIVTFSNGELHIYSTPIPAKDRRVTLMQDRLYRNDVTHRSMGYPHVPMTSYFLGFRR